MSLMLRHGLAPPGETPELLLDVGVGVALREDVRVLLPEDVAHSAAGEDLQAAAALPHPEGDLCTPDTDERQRPDRHKPPAPT